MYVQPTDAVDRTNRDRAVTVVVGDPLPGGVSATLPEKLLGNEHHQVVHTLTRVSKSSRVFTQPAPRLNRALGVLSEAIESYDSF